MDLFKPFFSEYPQWDWQQLEAFASSIREWNQKINIVSRKDIDQLEVNHILPSLAIAKAVNFKKGSHVLDIGTGGGFPGLPLAICFPEVKFKLIDSVGKKITVVNAIIEKLGLKNVTTQVIRAEKLSGRFEYIMGRAVTALPEFLSWLDNKYYSKTQILYLKGGNIQEEINTLGLKKATVYPLSDYFGGQYCQDKCLVNIRLF